MRFRNLGEYEGDLNVDERLVEDLIVACRSVAEKLDLLAPIPSAARPEDFRQPPLASPRNSGIETYAERQFVHSSAMKNDDPAGKRCPIA